MPPSEEGVALVGMFESLAEVHRTHASDCTALAREIMRFRAGHPELATAMKGAYQGIEADELLRERMQAAMIDVMTAGMGCRHMPAFRAARSDLGRPAR